MGEGKERSKKGFVYFIETNDGQFVKIGYSSDARKRFDSIGLLLPGIRMLGCIAGTRKTESALHRKFSAHRERGEWFRNTSEIQTFISSARLLRWVDEPEPEPEPILSAPPEPEPEPEPEPPPRIKDPYAVELARLRAESLTPERRKEIAKNAIAARWGKTKKAKRKG